MEIRELQRSTDERIAKTDERISKLVSAIGALIPKQSPPAAQRRAGPRAYEPLAGIYG